MFSVGGVCDVLEREHPPDVRADLPPAADVESRPSIGSVWINARVADVSETGQRLPLSTEGHGRLDVVAYRVALPVAGFGRPVVLDTRGWPEVREGLVASKKVWETIV